MVGFESYDSPRSNGKKESLTPKPSAAAQITQSLMGKKKIIHVERAYTGSHGGKTVKIKLRQEGYDKVELRVSEPDGQSVISIQTRFPRALQRYVRLWRKTRMQHAQLK